MGREDCRDAEERADGASNEPGFRTVHVNEVEGASAQESGELQRGFERVEGSEGAQIDFEELNAGTRERCIEHAAGRAEHGDMKAVSVQATDDLLDIDGNAGHGRLADVEDFERDHADVHWRLAVGNAEQWLTDRRQAPGRSDELIEADRGGTRKHQRGEALENSAP